MDLTGHPETRFGLDNKHRFRWKKSFSYPCTPSFYLLDSRFPIHHHQSKKMKLVLSFEQVHPQMLQRQTNFRSFLQIRSNYEPYFHHQTDLTQISLLNFCTQSVMVADNSPIHQSIAWWPRHSRLHGSSRAVDESPLMTCVFYCTFFVAQFHCSDLYWMKGLRTYLIA